MYKIWMVVDGVDYLYGTYDNRDRANEIAMQVRDERDINVWVEEI